MKDLILVVDDDPAFLKLVTIILEEEGYDVVTAESGEEAIKATQDNYFSLVLVDRKLPDTDGVKLLESFEDTEPKIRKIIFTGFPTIDNVQEAIALGAHAYLTKPVDPKEIIETVRKQIEERDREFKDKYPSLIES